MPLAAAWNGEFYGTFSPGIGRLTLDAFGAAGRNEIHSFNLSISRRPSAHPLSTLSEVSNAAWPRSYPMDWPVSSKLGGGFNFIDGFRRTAVYSRYTFDSVDSYLSARTGVDPFAYQFYDETFGDPDSRYRSTFWNVFVQDDWKITPRLKMNYGLRYDLYVIPKGRSVVALSGFEKFQRR